MTRHPVTLSLLSAGIVLLALAPRHATAQTEGTGAASAAAESARADAPAPIDLPGIRMLAPKEWTREEVPPAPMAPQAVLRLPKAEGDKDHGALRITHFPNMKGRDDDNIDRWIGQVTKSDGSPYTREEVKVEVIEKDHVRLKIVDLRGSVRATMRATPLPDARMIAAIVDHPEGPHFVVCYGAAETIKKWEKPIREFITSTVVK